jgi:hypothetical protein
LDHLTGDKAYSSRANRAALRARHIPTPSQSARTSRPTAPVVALGVAAPRPSTGPVPAAQSGGAADESPQAVPRGATRFDKLAERYAATVAVADIFIWLRARPDRSRGDPRNTP